MSEASSPTRFAKSRSAFFCSTRLRRPTRGSSISFLQVLDDGVLTSGRGDRVYFSETFIVFTSNLGIYTPGPSGERIANVTREETFDTVKRKVRGEIEKHFKSILNRPEILNRIGENVIVFDFIRPEVADEIFDQMVDALLNDVGSLGYDVSLSKTARA